MLIPRRGKLSILVDTCGNFSPLTRQKDVRTAQFLTWWTCGKFENKTVRNVPFSGFLKIWRSKNFPNTVLGPDYIKTLGNFCNRKIFSLLGTHKLVIALGAKNLQVLSMFHVLIKTGCDMLSINIGHGKKKRGQLGMCHHNMMMQS